jgi:hypothetical protein
MNDHSLNHKLIIGSQSDFNESLTEHLNRFPGSGMNIISISHSMTTHHGFITYSALIVYTIPKK